MESRNATEPTMVDLDRRFLEEYVPAHCKPSTQQEYRRSVKLFVDPVIGELSVREVQHKDIAALHHGLRDKPCQANRTLGVLSKMLSLAEVWCWCSDGSKLYCDTELIETQCVRYSEPYDTQEKSQ